MPFPQPVKNLCINIFCHICPDRCPWPSWASYGCFCAYSNSSPIHTTFVVFFWIAPLLTWFTITFDQPSLAGGFNPEKVWMKPPNRNGKSLKPKNRIIEIETCYEGLCHNAQKNLVRTNWYHKPHGQISSNIWAWFPMSCLDRNQPFGIPSPGTNYQPFKPWFCIGIGS